MSLKTLLVLFLFSGCIGLHAADLTTRDGKVYRNYKVLGHDTGYLTILYADGGGKIPLSDLPADLQKQYGYDPDKAGQFVEQDKDADRQARSEIAHTQLIQQEQTQIAATQFAHTQQAEKKQVQAQQEQLARQQEAAQPQPLDGFAAKFDSTLMVMVDNKPQDLDTHALTKVKYWAFYYSASWCPPCRAFTPSLVTFYKNFKPSHPQFELIFVNEDQSKDDMLSYMRNDAMTWPAVRYEKRRKPGLDAYKYAGKYIPALVLVDANGAVLSDTNQNGQYVGPEHVIDDIRTMVK